MGEQVNAQYSKYLYYSLGTNKLNKRRYGLHKIAI